MDNDMAHEKIVNILSDIRVSPETVGKYLGSSITEPLVRDRAIGMARMILNYYAEDLERQGKAKWE
jgi:hypothetical protein